MNDYIKLYVSGYTQYKYRAPFAAWKPVVMKIGTVRITLLGTLDAAYAAADIKEWNGKIRCDVVPASGFGTPDNLMATLAHKGRNCICGYRQSKSYRSCHRPDE